MYSHIISVQDVKKAVKKLKAGKSDGVYQSMSDYLINAPERFYVLLCMVLNSCIVHGIVPDEMSAGTIVPIIKNKRKTVNDSSNYRSVALSSIVGKIMDNVILTKFQHQFKCSDYQFGFRQNHSTTKCTFVIKEVIQYYRNKNCNAYLMLLDASQAFDRVDYVKLFQLLLKRGMCPIITRFLLNIYTNQTLCVRWGNIYSSTLEVSNGVKQGGVLSPILFNLYIDELLERLKKSGFGCHIGSIFMGAFCYADDCTLLGPSITSLKIMLKVVTQFSKEYNVKFNSAKSQLLVCSKDNHVVSNLSFNDSDICSSEDAYHLGHPVGTNEKSMCLLNCKKSQILLYLILVLVVLM